MPSKPLPPAIDTPCPCGTHKSLNKCCLPFIDGTSDPTTAEQLMRSRYSAHTLLAIDYLWETWSAEQRLRSNKSDIRAWAESCEWLGLQIISTQNGGKDDAEGIVEFVAMFRQQGQLQRHHEVSQFKKILGKWLYVDHRA